jgi:two-component system sensor histidine kinase UhpB
MHPSEDPSVAQLESALHASEARFRLIAEHARDLIGLLDPAGRRLYVNPAYERLLGERRGLVGRETFADMHPDDRERMRQHFGELVRTGYGPVAEFRLLTPKGEVRHIESHASTVREHNGRVRLVIAVARDVTERKVAEEALRARELQLREAQAIADIGSWEWQPQSGRLAWSEHMYRICGVDREAVQPSVELFFSLVHPEDRERCMAAAERSRTSGDAYDEPFRLVRPSDGSVRWFLGRSHADLDEAGQPVRIVGVLQDVTERYRAELELRARDLQRETAHALADLGGWEIDLVSGERTWSEQLYRIFGVSREDAPRVDGGSFIDMVHPDDRARIVEVQRRAMEGEDLDESPYRIVRPDGVVRHCRTRARVQRDAAGRAIRVVGFTQDVTERMHVADALRQYAEQLLITSRRVVDAQEAERRQLARELHDRVGPNLTALGINLRLIEESLPHEQRTRIAGTLRDSSRLVEETVAVTRDVMAGLRPQSLDDYGLVVALRTLAAGFTKRTGTPVSIRASDAPGRAPRPADLALFRIAQEALNNIAKHAQATRVEIRYTEGGGALSFEIEDNGRGFDRKRLEAGGGWGLLIMRERAASIGASFDVDSGPDRGVRLRVALGEPKPD